MPTDNWIILAYIMIFSSIVFCGLLPMILRLRNARQHYYHYNSDRRTIEQSGSHNLSTLKSIYTDVQQKIYQNLQRITSIEQPIIDGQIPYIDDETPV